MHEFLIFWVKVCLEIQKINKNLSRMDIALILFSVFLYLVEENNQLLTSLKKKVAAKMTCNFQPQKTHLVAFKKRQLKPVHLVAYTIVTSYL